jgi:hypothetical protein
MVLDRGRRASALLWARLPQARDPWEARYAIVEAPSQLRHLLIGRATAAREPVERISHLPPKLAFPADCKEGRRGSKGRRSVSGLGVQQSEDRVDDGEFPPFAERRRSRAAYIEIGIREEFDETF